MSSPKLAFPRGQYLAVTVRLTLDAGGQTAMFLMRTRLLAERAGIAPTLVSFDDQPDYARIRAALAADGRVTNSTVVVNLYEWLRYEYSPLAPDDAPELPPVEGLRAVDDPHPDGTVHVTTYFRDSATDPITDSDDQIEDEAVGEPVGDPVGEPGDEAAGEAGGEPADEAGDEPSDGAPGDATTVPAPITRPERVVTEYRRPDGTVYVRSGPDGVQLADRRGRVVRQFRDTGALRRWWLTRLFDPEPSVPVFLLCDSRFALRHLAPLTARRRVRLVHVVHNIHVADPYEPDISPVAPTHQPVLAAIPRLDALVTLTERQRDDITTRFGAADNIHVVPNPIDAPPPYDGPAERRPSHFVMLGRLVRQKQVDAAVVAFARVHAQEPGATLDIFGDGADRAALAEQIVQAGLQDAVRLRGHDPRAKEELRTATALLLTSRFEGYPLVVLEALARSCPVIAYDIAYGPREQIADGQTGFLVAPGDTHALADRMVQLVRDPDLVRRMGEAAGASAGDHSVDRYLRDWESVLQAVAERRAERDRQEKAAKAAEAAAAAQAAEAAQVAEAPALPQPRPDEPAVAPETP